MRAGVDVIASAKGTVIGTRNSVDDVLYTAANAANVEGKEFGNGLVLRHDDGWETQYFHMKKGSVQVKTGEDVEAGTILGQIGLSGRTQFPHVHLSVRKDEKLVDPFDPDGSVTCDEPDEGTLWNEPLPYSAGAVLYAAFADNIPAFEDVKSGRAAVKSLPVDAPAIVAFDFVFGAKKGDQMRLILEGPTGIMLDKTVLIERNPAQLFRAIGRKLPKAGWPVGTISALCLCCVMAKSSAQKRPKFLVE
ncbi:M23 family metallopeptidase [Ascidiaceihabitans sp.]|nr:M23 family metallopeptidase [Ascidiaceihabitans sp.]